MKYCAILYWQLSGCSAPEGMEALLADSCNEERKEVVGCEEGSNFIGYRCDDVHRNDDGHTSHGVGKEGVDRILWCKCP